MQVTASIFKAYDIRGTYLLNMDENLAEALGRAFGSLAMKEGRHTVAVGRDGRLSGPVLSAALMRGLVAVGIEVIDVGLTTTPQLYFAAHTVCDSGIQVTGSHNPKDDNGFKMVLGGRVFADPSLCWSHSFSFNGFTEMVNLHQSRRRQLKSLKSSRHARRWIKIRIRTTTKEWSKNLKSLRMEYIQKPRSTFPRFFCVYYFLFCFLINKKF